MSAEVAIRLTAVDEASAKIGGFFSAIENRLKAVEDYNKKLQNGSRALNGLISQGMALFGVAKLKQYIQAANEAAATQAKLDQALQRSGQYSQQTSKDLDSQATSLQRLTGYQDDQIKSVQTLLALSGQRGDMLKRLTSSSLNVASARGLDPAMVARTIGAALSGKDATGLQRFGIAVDSNASKAKQLEQVLKQLEGRYDGMAEAAQKAKGPYGEFAVEMDIAAQEFGKFLDLVSRPFMTGFNSALKDAGNYLKPVLDSIKDFINSQQPLFEMMGKIVGTLAPYLTAILAVGVGYKGLLSLLNYLVPIIGSLNVVLTGVSFTQSIAGLRAFISALLAGEFAALSFKAAVRGAVSSILILPIVWDFIKLAGSIEITTNLMRKIPGISQEGIDAMEKMGIKGITVFEVLRVNIIGMPYVFQLAMLQLQEYWVRTEAVIKGIPLLGSALSGVEDFISFFASAMAKMPTLFSAGAGKVKEIWSGVISFIKKELTALFAILEKMPLVGARFGGALTELKSKVAALGSDNQEEVNSELDTKLQQISDKRWTVSQQMYEAVTPILNEVRDRNVRENAGTPPPSGVAVDASAFQSAGKSRTLMQELNDLQQNYNTKLENTNLLYKLGQISEAQAQDQTKQLNDQYLKQLEEVIAKLQQRRAEAEASGDTEAMREYSQAINEANNAMLQLQLTQQNNSLLGQFRMQLQQAAADAVNLGKNLGGWVTNSISGLCNALGQGVVGAQSFGESMVNMAQQMISSFIAMIAQALIWMALVQLMNFIPGGTFVLKMMDATSLALADGGSVEPISNGIVTAGTTDRADDVLTWLSRGEFVFNAKAVRRLGVGFLRWMNGGGNPAMRFANNISAPAYADGGPIGGITSSLAGAFSNGMNANDNTNSKLVPIHLILVDDRSGAKEYIDSHEGRFHIMNIVHDNQHTFAAT